VRFIWIIGAAVAATALVLLLVQHRRDRSLLVPAVIGSIGAFLLVGGGLLAVDPATPENEAVKTGGLAAGSIVALYALWLNDRRRRTEESRHDVESERVSDERFARSVEMLGNEADQVRLGAMHALAGLARSRPEHTQTVLDVLCAYLRRPFSHVSRDEAPHDPDRATKRGDDAGELEREVRYTAQRLIRSLLTPVGADGPAYDVDLTAARLEYLNLNACKVHRLIARRAVFYGHTRLGGMVVSGPALFTSGHFHGLVDVSGSAFNGGLSVRDAPIDVGWVQRGTTAHGFADLSTPPPPTQGGALRVGRDTTTTVPEGWLVEGDVLHP
jgi:hypothetical protein